MKRIALVLTVLAAFVVGGSLMAAAPAKVTLKNTKGDVTFDHDAHAKAAGKCNVCHHDAKPDGAGAKKCSECHKAADEGKTLSIKNAAHKQCQECHAKSKTPKTPTKKCSDCHAKK